MGDTVDIGILASIAEHVDIMLAGTATKQKTQPFRFDCWHIRRAQLPDFLYISLPACSTKNPIAKKRIFNFHI